MYTRGSDFSILKVIPGSDVLLKVHKESALFTIDLANSFERIFVFKVKQGVPALLS